MTIADNSPTFWVLVICVLVGLPASLILGVSIGGKVIRSLRGGVAVSSSRAEYRRVDTPFLFWLTLSLQAFNTLACFLVAFALAGFAILCFLGSRQGHNVSRPHVEIQSAGPNKRFEDPHARGQRRPLPE